MKNCCDILQLKPKGFDLPDSHHYLIFSISEIALPPRSVPPSMLLFYASKKRTSMEVKHYRKTVAVTRLTICSIAFHRLCAQNRSSNHYAWTTTDSFLSLQVLSSQCQWSRETYKPHLLHNTTLAIHLWFYYSCSSWLLKYLSWCGFSYRWSWIHSLVLL